jgi:catechol 2,3-dioxygenase-like lactoylglutathione lyase family enzyme
MVQTYGLTHINLSVRDLRRSLRFYKQVFGP